VNEPLIVLALLMGAVTWPSRALPLLLPGIDRLPRLAHEYLRHLGPAALASLAAVSALVVVEEGAAAALRLGVEALAVAVCVAIVAWRRQLLVGLAAAVVLVAVSRALGLG
jgi:branched-subunit amino acid transport protein